MSGREVTNSPEDQPRLDLQMSLTTSPNMPPTLNPDLMIGEEGTMSAEALQRLESSTTLTANASSNVSSIITPDIMADGMEIKAPEALQNLHSQDHDATVDTSLNESPNSVPDAQSEVNTSGELLLLRGNLNHSREQLQEMSKEEVISKYLALEKQMSMFLSKNTGPIPAISRPSVTPRRIYTKGLRPEIRRMIFTEYLLDMEETQECSTSLFRCLEILDKELHEEVQVVAAPSHDSGHQRNAISGLGDAH